MKRLMHLLFGVLFTTTVHAAPDNGSDKDSEALAELTRPQSTVEIGAGSISASSFAAGNYNGLDKKGGLVIGNIDLRSSQYSFGNSSDDKMRWRLTGTDLGLNSRSLAGEYGPRSVPVNRQRVLSSPLLLKLYWLLRKSILPITRPPFLSSPL